MPVTPGPDLNLSQGMFISNEGNFGFGNASVSYYDLEKDALHLEVFQTANNRNLGDVLQSIQIIGDNAYLILNNSNKIEVATRSDLKSISTIEGFTSPRYLLPINDQKAYVSDLYANAISIVDLQNHSIIREIELMGWSEEMVLVENIAYVTVRDNSFLYLIDTEDDILVDSIEVGFNPSTIQVDRDNNIWVLCSGDPLNQILGGLYQIDPDSKSVLQKFQFNETNIGGWPRLRINGSRDTLYFLKEDVFQFPIGSANLPNQALIPANGRIWYGLGIEPKTGKIFVSDAIDYQQAGLVFQYKSDGSPIDSFRVGVIPNDFYFFE